MPHRFFIPPAWLGPSGVTLTGDPARQIRNVLRLRPGDQIIVLDNSGWEFAVELSQVGQEVRGRLLSRRPAQGEPALQLTLYQGLLKGSKFEWVLQKGTELGLNRFVPTLCARSVTNDAGAVAKKRERWERIIAEAAEQSGRGKLPVLAEAMPLAEALAQARSTSLILFPWEAAPEEPSLKAILAGQPVQPVALFIGPEGGFTPAEAELAGAAGGHLLKLGPRMLRAETAGLALAAAICYGWGEWG